MEKAKAKKQGGTNNGYDIQMHPERADIPPQGLDRRLLTVAAISDFHCQIGALNWYHFTSNGFIWSERMSKIEHELSMFSQIQSQVM